MLELTSGLIAITSTLVTIKFFLTKNFYEKVLSFYFIFIGILTLILLNSKADFNSAFDIIIILFTLKIATILFFLRQKKEER